MRKIITLLACLMLTIASLYSEFHTVRRDFISETSYIVLYKHSYAGSYCINLYDTKDWSRWDSYYIDECEQDDGLIFKFYTDLIDHKAWRNFTKEFVSSGLDNNNGIYTVWKVHKITTK